MKKREVLGLSFDDVDAQEAAALALALMAQRRSACAVTPNAEILLAAQRDRLLREAIAAAELVLPDGVGVLIVSRLLGRRLNRRCPGVDFAAAVMEKLAARGGSAFLLGGRPGVAARAEVALRRRFPGLVIAGTQHGYYAPEEESAILARINLASPDFLLVCLGSPRQELWMRRHRRALHLGLMAGLGGALDVFSGDCARAPRGWRRLGLEWLFRLLREPKRIKRIAKLPALLFLAVRHRIRG